MSPHSIQAQAGHANYNTTEHYIRLANVVFSAEVAKHDTFYGSGVKQGCQEAAAGGVPVSAPAVGRERS